MSGRKRSKPVTQGQSSICSFLSPGPAKANKTDSDNEIIEERNLIDPFRELYPSLQRYTWRKRTPFKQADVQPNQVVQSGTEGQTPTTKDETAMGRLKESLHKVKVSKYDADELQRKLEGELFDKWSEGCEVMSAKQIPFDTLKEYLDHLQDAYEGIDDGIRKKLDGVLFATTTWEHRLIEWKFNKGDDSGARYGLIAFGRSPDQKFVDCMYVMYKMDFKVAPQRIVTQKQHSWFWGLIKYNTEKVEIVDRALGANSIQTMQNFFRIKALEGFYKEGLIESINYVNSLEDIPDLNAT